MTLTPEERRQLIEQSRETREAVRSVLSKVLLIVWVIGMALLVMMLRAVHDPLGRLFVYVVMFIGVVWILRNYPLRDDPLLSRLRGLAEDRSTNRSLITPGIVDKITPQGQMGDDSAKCAPETGCAPPGAGAVTSAGGPSPGTRRIDNLAELPPELASNPDFQKLFQDARNLGGSVLVSASHPAQPNLDSVQDFPPGLAANSDVEKLVERARALGGRVQTTRLGAKKSPFVSERDVRRVTGLPSWLILAVYSVLAALVLAAFASFVTGLLRR